MTSTEDGSWYPSCVVVLTIRFDEAIQVATDASDKPTARARAAQTQQDRITGEAIVDTPGGPRTTRSPKHRPRRALDELTAAQQIALNNSALRAVDVYSPTSSYGVPDASPVADRGGQASGDDPGGHVQPLTLGTDGFTVIANRVPGKSSFKLPHPRTAGQFSISFDYQEFPVDPRLIRAVGVEVHVGAVSASDYARGMNGERDSDGRPLSVLKTTSALLDPWSGRPAANDATLLLYGIADNWKVSHDEHGSRILVEGRDLRGIFIDKKVTHTKVQAIDLTKPIDKVIEDLIKTMGCEHDLRITIATNAAEWPDGVVPSPGDVNGLTRVRLNTDGDRANATPATASQTSYWDLITNYCTLVGSMPVFQGSILWIRPSRSVFDVLDKRSKIAPPFAGARERRVGDERLRARRLVYGRDLSKLEFDRKFAGAVVPTVQCISFTDEDGGSQRLIFGQWPPESSAQAKGKGENELLRVPIWGVRSTKRLSEIAHGIYEEVGRGETGGEAATKNLASYGGGNADPDMLRLRPLEPVEFLVDARALHTQAPVVSELANVERRTFSEEVEVLHRRLGDRAVARALVALARGAVRELLTFYQVIGVQYDWDKGMAVSFTFQNYIVPRHQVAESSAPRTADVRVTRVEVTGAHHKATVGVAHREAWDPPAGPPDPGVYLGDGRGSEATDPPGAPASPANVLRHRYRKLAGRH